MFRPALPPAPPVAGWWNRRWFVVLMVLAATVPLLWPAMPPLTDLPGHLGRYRVELSDPDSLLRTRYYEFHWRFLANLGVDLLIIPMAKLFGLELGLKLVVIVIPALTVFGLLWIAREAHGRVPPTALFALPLAYSFPLLWGFLNFMLSMALALNAYALWLRLGRLGQMRRRAVLFVPIGLALTVAHIFGWAVLCLLAYASEVVRQRDAARGVWASLWRGGLACLPLAPPLLLLVVWRVLGEHAPHTVENVDFFDWRAKYVYLISALRTQWMIVDLASVYLLWGMIGFGLGNVWLRVGRTLGIASLLLMIAYALLPRILFNSAYADMRLAPFVLGIAVVAITPKGQSRRHSSLVAGLGLTFYFGRLAMLTVNFADHEIANNRQLVALDHIRPGSRVFAEVALPCLGKWETSRMEHLGSLAIVRRDAFVNGQWEDPGAQLLTIRYAPARGYAEDPTQILRPYRCRARKAKTYPEGINALPQGTFDYVWLIDMPRRRWNSFPGLTPIWMGEASGILYRVEPSWRPLISETPTSG